jgi:heme oxygenase (biliverdin-IX-beta and delta-forming)
MPHALCAAPASALAAAAAAPSALTYLRDTTASAHAAIERQLDLDLICDRRHYAAVVATFEWFTRHWQRRVADALPLTRRAWFLGRSRQPMARADLTVLGQCPRDDADPTLSIGLAGEAAALGSMYVMEGSALGGQLIARALAERLGIRADTGASYFHGWGAHTGRQWKAFRELAEQRLGGPAQAADRVAAGVAACATFAALGAAFTNMRLPDDGCTPFGTRDDRALLNRGGLERGLFNAAKIAGQ